MTAFIGGQRSAVGGLKPVFRLALSVLVAAFSLVPSEASGQAVRVRNRAVQLGVGVLPGIGLQGGYVYPRSFYTTEALLYADASPEFAGGESNLQLSLGIGASIRPLSIVRALGGGGQSAYELDVGLRGGPGLFFASEETRDEKNQRFSLFLEPFIRVSTQPGRQTFFAELGFQRPLIRAGVWFGL